MVVKGGAVQGRDNNFVHGMGKGRAWGATDEPRLWLRDACSWLGYRDCVRCAARECCGEGGRDGTDGGGERNRNGMRRRGNEKGKVRSGRAFFLVFLGLGFCSSDFKR